MKQLRNAKALCGACQLRPAALCLLAVIGAGNLAELAGQTPIPKFPPNLSLVPVALVNVGMDGAARAFKTPTGIQLPMPEFVVPRNGTKLFDIATSGGNVRVNFSNSVPAGVPAGAFAWETASAPAGNAVGRLRYNGCASCPVSFTFGVTASSNGSDSGSIKLTLVASNSRPSISSVVLSRVPSQLEPEFRINFAAGSVDPSDTEIVARYAGNLLIRLTAVNPTNFANGIATVVIPRLALDRSVQVFMRNPYGSSSIFTVQLPAQSSENPGFGCVNCGGPAPPDGTLTSLKQTTVLVPYTATHINIGPVTVSGTDEIGLQSIFSGNDTSVRSGALPCGQVDFIYTGSRATWFDANGHPTTSPGTVSIVVQPPVNAPLRRPANNVRMAWTLNAFQGTKIYQIVASGAFVEGVCADRITR